MPKACPTKASRPSRVSSPSWPRHNAERSASARRRRVTTAPADEVASRPSACPPPQVMIYELADHIQGFLSEHNKPPSRSFHEEMLKNQRRQQEKLAQEEQQRVDQQRRRAEETVRRRRRRISDLQLCVFSSALCLSDLTLLVWAQSCSAEATDIIPVPG